MRTIKDKVRWIFRRILIDIIRIFRPSSKTPIPERPKQLKESQNMAVDIIVKCILDPASELYYDMETRECYIKKSDPSGDIYFFLEYCNIKMINTVFGYDITIDIDTKNYISAIFKRELNKRRSKFKRDAISKVEFSLQKALRRVNKSK